MLDVCVNSLEKFWNVFPRFLKTAIFMIVRFWRVDIFGATGAIAIILFLLERYTFGECNQAKLCIIISFKKLEKWRFIFDPNKHFHTQKFDLL